MPSDHEMFSGWNSTDDEVQIPVRSSATPSSVTISQADEHETGIESPNISQAKVITEHAPTARGMKLSAALGVLLSLGGVSLYFGIGDINLQGALTGNLLTSNVQTITITEDGEFSPNSVTVEPGNTVTIENKNSDPQVVKPKDSRDLFPVQVIFNEPYTFTVPVDASGEYVYYSETLPEEKTIRFIVTETASETPQEETIATNTNEDTISIPLPFGGGTVDIAAPLTQEIQTQSPVMTEVVSTVHSDDTATIELGGNPKNEQGESALNDSAIPTNPYTVASAPKQTINEIIATAEEKSLHSGAPLLVETLSMPKRTPESGMGGFTLLFIPALLGVFTLSKRMSVV